MAGSQSEKHLMSLSLLALVGALMLLAWSHRFIQDDAFISFRYADYLASGQGLVWYPGDHIEGYTNFLWTVLIALPQLLGWEPVLSAQLLGLACFVGSLLCTFQLAAGLLKSETLALIALLLLGTNYSFSAYATGGLETQLQAFLVCAILLITQRLLERPAWSKASLIGLSLGYSFALMTRLDSAIFVSLSGIFLLWRLYRRPARLSEKLSNVLALGLPSLLLVGGWLIWKLFYYGNILPNTYYAKAQLGMASQIQGLKYVQLFVVSYGFVFLLAIPVLYRLRLAKSFNPELRLSAAAVALWVLYVVRVGGDFMEFRFFVPVLPAFFILVTWLLFRVVERPAVSCSVVVLLLAGSAFHARTFGYDPVHGVEGIADLSAHIESPEQDWDGIGRTLRAYFGPGSSVRLATTAAGAIPFYSKLATVDMLGLNDAWIARNGLPLGNRPGHQKTARFDYLIDQKVNLVLGHPMLLTPLPSSKQAYHLADLADFRIFDAPLWIPDQRLQVVDIPFRGSKVLRVLYLTPHPEVEAAIERHKLKTFPVEGSVRALASAR